MAHGAGCWVWRGMCWTLYQHILSPPPSPLRLSPCIHTSTTHTLTHVRAHAQTQTDTEPPSLTPSVSSPYLEMKMQQTSYGWIYRTNRGVTTSTYLRTVPRVLVEVEKGRRVSDILKCRSCCTIESELPPYLPGWLRVSSCLMSILFLVAILCLVIQCRLVSCGHRWCKSCGPDSCSTYSTAPNGHLASHGPSSVSWPYLMFHDHLARLPTFTNYQCFPCQTCLIFEPC